MRTIRGRLRGRFGERRRGHGLSGGPSDRYWVLGENEYWEPESMAIHLINPSDNSLGTEIITPRWR